MGTGKRKHLLDIYTRAGTSPQLQTRLAEFAFVIKLRWKLIQK